MSTLNELFNQLIDKGFGIDEAKSYIESLLNHELDYLKSGYSDTKCSELTEDVASELVNTDIADHLTLKDLVLSKTVILIINEIPNGVYSVTGIYPQTQQIRFDGSENRGSITVNYGLDLDTTEFSSINSSDKISCVNV